MGIIGVEEGLKVGLSSCPPLRCAGIQRFCRDIHMMLGFKPGLYFRACWLFLSPATLLVTGVGEGLSAGPPWAFSLVGLSWPRVDLCQG